MWKRCQDVVTLVKEIVIGVSWEGKRELAAIVKAEFGIEKLIAVKYDLLEAMAFNWEGQIYAKLEIVEEIEVV